MITMMNKLISNPNQRNWCSKQSSRFSDSFEMTYRHILGAHPG